VERQTNDHGQDLLKVALRAIMVEACPYAEVGESWARARPSELGPRVDPIHGSRMLKYIVIGGGLAFAAAVQPGPLQAYLLSRVAAIGWRRTLPAALSPLLSDGPIALLALLVLGRLSSPMQSALRVAGGVLLIYLAWRAFLQWLRHVPGSLAPGDRVPRTLLEAALVNVLNPNPYLGWALVLGPLVLAAWQEAPGRAVTVVVAFYATMISMLAALIFAFGSARLLGPKLQRALLLVSGVILAGLGLYQLVVGLRCLTAA
jgi:threonine/homoserine/homoserine lactone efflux protein